MKKGLQFILVLLSIGICIGTGYIVGSRYTEYEIDKKESVELDNARKKKLYKEDSKEFKDAYDYVVENELYNDLSIDKILKLTKEKNEENNKFDYKSCIAGYMNALNGDKSILNLKSNNEILFYKYIEDTIKVYEKNYDSIKIEKKVEKKVEEKEESTNEKTLGENETPCVQCGKIFTQPEDDDWSDLCPECLARDEVKCPRCGNWVEEYEYDYPSNQCLDCAGWM